MVFHRAHLNLGYRPDEPHGVNGLPELIEFNAIHNPNSVFGIQQTRSSSNGNKDDIGACVITFTELKDAVERCSAWLVRSGVTPGRMAGDENYPPAVGILLGSDITIYIYIAALLRIGTPVLCLSARLTPIAIAHLVKTTGASSVLFNHQVSILAEETKAHLTASDCRFVDAPSYHDFLVKGSLSGDVPPAYVHKKRHDLGAVIMHSSGTTGLPKPIYHAPSYLLVYAACHQMPKQDEPFAYNVSTLPLYHGFGLLAPSLSLSIGLPFILSPSSIIPTARSTLTTLRNTVPKPRFLMSVPSILEDMLKMKDLADDALQALRELEFVAIGGAPMKENVGSELVKNGVRLLNHWGATEIGAIALIQPIPQDYDWHYLIPRTDINLEFHLLDPSTRSYRLIGHPHGWPSPFHVQDSLQMHPTSKTTQVRILGRTDDLIVLANGEKILPTSIEKTIAEHPCVKDVLVFGEGRDELGVLIELLPGVVVEEGTLEPFIENANKLTDSHGKIAGMDMVLLTRSDIKPLLRTDKGSLAKKANYAAFEEEIKACYDEKRKEESGGVSALSMEDVDALRNVIRLLIGLGGEKDDVDFFEMGMDSLKATRLRNRLQQSLKVTPGCGDVELPLDFVFQHSSVDKLVRALIQGSDVGGDGGRREAKMQEMVDRYVEELRSFLRKPNPSSLAQVNGNGHLTNEATHVNGNGYAINGVTHVNGLVHSPTPTEKVILLTGSTGSLGCMLLEQLVADTNVSKVLCLNRPKDGVDAKEYQLSLMAKRGAAIDEKDLEKVVFLQGHIGETDLGLSEEQYRGLFSVTHVIHNAWPVDFNRNLSSFEGHIKAVYHLLQLCHRSDSKASKRLLFTSSIAVVGRYPVLHADESDIPELPHSASCTAEFGYPEAKWVCEQLMFAANEMCTSVECSVVRIGQMTGPEGSGAWNEMEHFPIIVRASKAVGALPFVEGSLSWMPVNRAASVVLELLSTQDFKPVYHLENPSRQSWSGVLHTLSRILDAASTLPIIPYPDWLSKVKDAKEKDPLKIMSFLENDFLRMAAGDVILRTTNAKMDSKTMVRSTAVDGRHLEEYCAYWRRNGCLV